jgi:hypothetical protein
MNDKKHTHFDSPNTNKMQAVVIDHKTTIYISLDADPDKARQRFLFRTNPKKEVFS